MHATQAGVILGTAAYMSPEQARGATWTSARTSGPLASCSTKCSPGRACSEETLAQFSPDSRFVAYQTNESGRFKIVVQRFPEPGGKWHVSTGGGTEPRWRADCKELYFIAPDGKLMAAAVSASGSAFETGTPVALFTTRIAGGVGNSFRSRYAVSRDGRFLINQLAEESATAPITLILNWQAALGARERR